MQPVLIEAKVWVSMSIEVNVNAMRKIQPSQPVQPEIGSPSFMDGD